MIFSSNSFFVQAYILSAGITFLISIQTAIMASFGYRSELYRKFSLLSLAITGYLLSTAWLYMAPDVDHAALALKVQAGMLCVMPFPFLRFIALYTGRTKLEPWMMFVIAYFAILFVANLIFPFGIRFTSLEKVDELMMPWGESLNQYTGENNILFSIFRGSMLVILLWGIHRGLSQCKQNNDHRGIYLVISLTLLVLSTIWGSLIDYGFIHSIYIAGFAYLSLVLLISFSLANELKENTKLIQRANTYKSAMFATEHYLGNMMNMFLLIEMEHSDDGKLRPETVKLMKEEIAKTQRAVRALCDLEEPTSENISSHIKRHL